MTPVLSEEMVKETVAKFENYLIEKGCEMVHQESWGLRKLAYPIQKKSTGFYHLFEFKGDPTVIDGFEIAFKRDEKILRYMTVKLDKYARQFNVNMRAKSSKSETVAN